MDFEMASDVDCSIYDEVGVCDTQEDKRGHNIYEDVLKKNNSYNPPICVCEKTDKRDASFSKNNMKKIIGILAVVIGLLALSLVAAFTYFALEIAALRSQIDSSSQATSISMVSDNTTEVEAAYFRQLQQAFDIISEKLENVTNQLDDTDTQVQLIEQAANIKIENVEDQFNNITNAHFRLFEDGLNIISEKLENVTDQLNDVAFELSHQGTHNRESQKLIEMVTDQLYNVTERVQQLSLSYNMNGRQLQDVISKLSFEFNSPTFPASSCAVLPPSYSSGYYWVRAFNGSAVRVYCDMVRSCGGVTGGWMRVAHLDMTNSSQQCPSGFNQRMDSSIRSCVKNATNCLSISVPVIFNYTRVCGRVIAYQKGVPQAFHESFGGINSPYVDGVSITHGSPRQHIWTFATALNEVETLGPSLSCPCIRGNSVTSIPSFVGESYFCDTGSQDRYDFAKFYSNNPLWDGAGCGPAAASTLLRGSTGSSHSPPQTTLR